MTVDARSATTVGRSIFVRSCGRPAAPPPAGPERPAVGECVRVCVRAVQAEDLAVPVGVHAGREQRVHVDDPAALAGVQRPRAEVGDLGVEFSAAIVDTCALLSRVIPSVSTSRSIRRVLTPSR